MNFKGYSEKSDGNMYLSREGFDPENVANRERYFERLGLSGKKIMAANLVHGTRVEVVDASSPEFLLDTDTLVTREKNIVLTLTGADCFPVYFEDTAHSIIGLAHCGWRGIVGGVLTDTIKTIASLVPEKLWIPDPSKGGQVIRDDTDEASRNITVTIGPGICGKCFEIQENIVLNFSEYPEAIIREGERVRVDLRAIMKTQLERLGIPRKNITDQNECTSCLSEKYFSYRRDKPARLETQVAYIVR